MEIKESHLQEFVNRAKAMRDTQKDFFRRGGSDRKMKAIIAEQAFDKALTWFADLIKAKPAEQQSLDFNNNKTIKE